MPSYSLADARRLYPANTPGIQTDPTAVKINGSAIEGVLKADELIVSQRSLDSEGAPLKRSCPRFKEWELQTTGDIPGHTHGFCDVLAGETSEGLRVVIESHRCYTADSQGNVPALKRFNRHALVCSGLSHTNIVPFLGVFSSSKLPFGCVFESTGEQNLSEYLSSKPDAPRLKLLLDVARGLHHIHDLEVAHNCIRGTNVRVDGNGTAKIAGFASATLLPEAGVASEDGDTEINVSRWCSPEILHPRGFGLTRATATKASDMYAFGMLSYEVFSGHVPFHDRQDTAAIITVITTDERPSRPNHRQLSNPLWEMIEKCWRKEPLQRPTIREVVTFLQKAHSGI